MSTVTVTSTAGLLQALGAAHAGDTVLLAAGTYSGVNIQNLNPSGTVTISSATPGNPATITDMQVNASSNLSFTGLVTNVSQSALSPIAVNNSNHISFSDVSFHGSLDGNPLDDMAYGVKISSSTNVSVTNSEFQQLSFGIVTDDASSQLTFTGNDFHDIHLEGIASNSSFVTITGNYFHDFDPQTGEHPDAVHFWNQTATDAPHNVTVDNNVVMIGNGNPIQGIYFELPTEVPSSVPLSNITVDNNLLVGTMYNAISITDTGPPASTGIQIENNTIASTNANMLDRILLGNSTGAVVTNNTAAAFLFGPGGNPSFTPTNTNANLTYTNNTTSSIVSDGGQALLHQYLAANPGFVLPAPVTFSSTPPPAPPASPPSLSNSGPAVGYQVGGAAVGVAHSLAVTDTASSTLASASVAITGGFLAGDTLNFANQAGITGSYNASTGVLALSGSASLAAYQTALDSVTFSSSSADPTHSLGGAPDPLRTVTFTINDGFQNSNSVTGALTVAVWSLSPLHAGISPGLTSSSPQRTSSLPPTASAPLASAPALATHGNDDTLGGTTGGLAMTVGSASATAPDAFILSSTGHTVAHTATLRSTAVTDHWDLSSLGGLTLGAQAAAVPLLDSGDTIAGATSLHHTDFIIPLVGVSHGVSSAHMLFA
jgi:Right handed beta helix region